MTRHQGPGHECPECNGTGVVLVFPHRGDAAPLRDVLGKDEFRAMASPYTERCGVCGGDGWVGPLDELVDYKPVPIEWLLDEKRRLASTMREQAGR